MKPAVLSIGSFPAATMAELASRLKLPNVIVQPHHGSATVETRTAIGRLMIDNLAAWFGGRPLLTPVA